MPLMLSGRKQGIADPLGDRHTARTMGPAFLATSGLPLPDALQVARGEICRHHPGAGTPFLLMGPAHRAL
jgi:hypothetical protein